MTLHPDVLGIDISKLHLDIHDARDGTTWRITNGSEAITGLTAALGGRDCLVVFEATGRYGRALRQALAAAGIAHAQVNPEQARHFARATGRRAKTDPIDARMLADLGARLSLRRTAAADPARDRLGALSRRRDQLVAIRQQERVRAHDAHDAAIAADLAAHLAWLDAAVQRHEHDIAQLVRQDAALDQIDRLLRSVPGVGPVTAAVLIGQLPELGHTSAKAISALAGLAPYNNDSGAMRGKRSVRGGRRRIRQALYMAALSIARGHSPLAVFHKRLRDAGKPAKVALIATARKLLVTLNAVARHQTPFLHAA